MNAVTYINSLGLKDESRLPMARYLYPSHFKEKEVNVGWEEIKNRLHCLESVEPFKFDDNPFELMGVVNRMSKSPTMPNNLKNRFYTYKHRIINKCLSDKRITEIFDEGDCYSITIDGNYHFHTLKHYYPNGLRCDGVREKDVNTVPLTFDINTFRKFMANAVLFCQKKN